MVVSRKAQHGVSSSEHQRRWEEGARTLEELDPDLVRSMERTSKRAGVAVVVLLSSAAVIGASVVGSIVR